MKCTFAPLLTQNPCTLQPQYDRCKIFLTLELRRFVTHNVTIWRCISLYSSMQISTVFYSYSIQSRDKDMPFRLTMFQNLYLLEYVSDVMTSVTTAVCLPVHPNFVRYLARWSFICQFVELMWCWYFPTSPLQMMEATGGTGAAFYHSISAITSPQHQPLELETKAMLCESSWRFENHRESNY